MDPFEQNIEQTVGRNSIIYRCLTPSPAQALLFGNGPVGGSLHTPDDSLYLLIGRCDNWSGNNRMGAIAAVRVRGDTGLFTNAKSVRQECNLYEAVIRIALETVDGEVRFGLTAVRGQDLLVLDIEDHRRKKAPFTVTLENWHEGDETTPTETVHVNRTSVFEAMNRKVGLEPSAVPVADPLLGRAWGLFVEGHAPSWPKPADATERVPPMGQRILIATACSMAGADAVRQAGNALLAEACRCVDQWLVEHRRWWAEFWSRSYVSLNSATGDAEYEERLWYVTLYTIACGSPESVSGFPLRSNGGAAGELPLRFNGGPFLLEKDARSWDNEYVFQNMREIYWPLLAAGHWEFMRAFFRLYFGAKDFVRAQTKSLFGIDALCYREGMTVWGCDPAPRNGHTHFYLSGNLECCLLMEWYWRASGDESFLRNEFYPFLKEILEFYMSYAKKGDDGKYHLAPVNALETWWQAVDDLPDLCGLHYFLPRAIEWEKKFGENAPTMKRWSEFLQNLAPIPIGRWTTKKEFWQGIHTHEQVVHAKLDSEGIFLAAAAPGADQTEHPSPPTGGGRQGDFALNHPSQCDFTLKRHNMENPELYVIFPWGAVGMDSPPREVRRAEETWEHRTWRYANNGWAQDAVQLARMGWAERAKEAQMDHASRHQRFPNGSFISAAAPLFHELLTDTPYFDTAGVHAAALNEMLLQSYDGLIRLAPAVSAEWSGHFKLHALGGFVVNAHFHQGKPTAAQIAATRDSRLRVRNHRREKMRAHDKTIATGEIFERDMKAGETIFISWEGVSPAASEEGDQRPEMIYPGYKSRPPGVATRTGHWHDESVGHGQVGLAEDGLFPATRNFSE
ncbi:MAG: hypothetical protein HY360_13640 [Verrucomicrobia bacterium]|nr:hypothetical protein [Verrucomicrobiota bacterium]